MGYQINIDDYLDEREKRLINNCITYAADDPAGLPGHNLMVIIAKIYVLSKLREDGYETDQSNTPKPNDPDWFRKAHLLVRCISH